LDEKIFFFGGRGVSILYTEKKILRMDFEFEDMYIK